MCVLIFYFVLIFEIPSGFVVLFLVDLVGFRGEKARKVLTSP